MATPILTPEQREALFTEAATWVDGGVDLNGSKAPDPGRVRAVRDAVSVLDVLGWEREAQDAPLSTLDHADDDDLEAFARFVGPMEADFAEEAAKQEVEYRYHQVRVEACRAISAAVGEEVSA